MEVEIEDTYENSANRLWIRIDDEDKDYIVMTFVDQDDLHQIIRIEKWDLYESIKFLTMMRESEG